MASGVIGLILFAVAAVIAVVWILFPFLVYGELRSLNKASSDSNHYLKLLAEKAYDAEQLGSVIATIGSVRPRPTPPAMPKQAPKPVVTRFLCEQCSQVIEVECGPYHEDPPTVTCPHCGKETRLSTLA